MEIPFLDLRSQYLEMQDELDRAAQQTLSSGWYVLGERCSRFERRLKDYLVEQKAGHTVGVNSGTDALVLSLMACGVGPGDEVLTVANTAIPTAAAITAVGAKPVFCDVDPETWLMDPAAAEFALTKKTMAIMPVHLYGNVADMTKLSKMAKEHGLPIIEDTAQAMGAEWKGRKAGTIGRFGAFSFYPSKNLGACGDAGAVFCTDAEDESTLNKLRNYGQESRYNAVLAGGLNSRLDEMQAALLTVKITRMDNWTAIRQEMREEMVEMLSSLSEMSFQKPTPGSKPAWHLLVTKVKTKNARDNLAAHLAKQGVNTLIHYPIALHKQSAFSRSNPRGRKLKITEDLCDTVLSLPFHPYLNSEQIAHIGESCRSFFTK